MLLEQWRRKEGREYFSTSGCQQDRLYHSWCLGNPLRPLGVQNECKTKMQPAGTVCEDESMMHNGIGKA